MCKSCGKGELVFQDKKKVDSDADPNYTKCSNCGQRCKTTITTLNFEVKE